MWTTIASLAISLFSKGKGFFVKNKGAVIISALIAILLLVNVYQYNTIKHKNKELAVAAHNIAAANDTIRITKDKAGKDEFNKLAFQAQKVKDLEKLNADLAKEVKETKGKVQTIVKTQTVIKTDTVEIAAITTETDSSVVANFNYDTTFSQGNFRHLKGFTNYNKKTQITTASLTTDEIGISLVTGIKNADKGKPEIFVRSNYPGFTVTDLQGAIIDPNLLGKQKQPLLTVGMGIGWVPVTYDFKTKQLDGNIQRVGIVAGINVNLIRLFKK